MKGREKAAWVSTITTVIFDIDDTLYPASCGFSGHRNGPIVGRFMVDHLGFSSEKEALDLRDQYFRQYHSTLKGLSVASNEGKLPPGIRFRQESLGEYWAAHCDFDAFLERDDQFVADFDALPKRKIAFTNAPRAYGLRCLDTLGLAFDEVFGVEDVMPHCKPEPESFEKILKGVDPTTCLMVEDSMKNVRACHALGIRTVLVKEPSLEAQSEAALLGDDAHPDDPAVDVVIPRVQDLRNALPGLWT